MESVNNSQDSDNLPVIPSNNAQIIESHVEQSCQEDFLRDATHESIENCMHEEKLAEDFTFELVILHPNTDATFNGYSDIYTSAKNVFITIKDIPLRNNGVRSRLLSINKGMVTSRSILESPALKFINSSDAQLSLVHYSLPTFTFSVSTTEKHNQLYSVTRQDTVQEIIDSKCVRTEDYKETENFVNYIDLDEHPSNFLDVSGLLESKMKTSEPSSITSKFNNSITFQNYVMEYITTTPIEFLEDIDHIYGLAYNFEPVFENILHEVIKVNENFKIANIYNSNKWQENKIYINRETDIMLPQEEKESSSTDIQARHWEINEISLIGVHISGASNASDNVSDVIMSLQEDKNKSSIVATATITLNGGSYNEKTNLKPESESQIHIPNSSVQNQQQNLVEINEASQITSISPIKENTESQRENLSIFEQFLSSNTIYNKELLVHDNVTGLYKLRWLNVPQTLSNFSWSELMQAVSSAKMEFLNFANWLKSFKLHSTVLAKESAVEQHRKDNFISTTKTEQKLVRGSNDSGSVKEVDKFGSPLEPQKIKKLIGRHGSGSKNNEMTAVVLTTTSSIEDAKEIQKFDSKHGGKIVCFMCNLIEYSIVSIFRLFGMIILPVGRALKKFKNKALPPIVLNDEKVFLDEVDESEITENTDSLLAGWTILGVAGLSLFSLIIAAKKRFVSGLPHGARTNVPSTQTSGYVAGFTANRVSHKMLISSQPGTPRCSRNGCLRPNFWTIQLGEHKAHYTGGHIWPLNGKSRSLCNLADSGQCRISRSEHQHSHRLGRSRRSCSLQGMGTRGRVLCSLLLGSVLSGCARSRSQEKEGPSFHPSPVKDYLKDTT